MTRTIKASGQASLFDWQPPEAVVEFDPFVIRANSFSGRLSRAISIALDTSSSSRAEIADRMGRHMGRTISVNVLNAYASVAREDHQISVPRFDALVAATGDRRLLEFVARDHGWAVIDRHYLPCVELAAMAEHRAALGRRERELRASVRRGMR
ncbi:hypothetical protein [Acetobacter sp. DsW_063]|uniref:hypothetical protein n=1 Tax=Acetobacter sp. DsW_063 TaxID=1514894 RepID=UPI000A392A69|nr:hypothetical protein [Acetobacter sp. DsW_063]OUJ17087.1 hypothetical protein HK28_07930 [Acetobacter sp. DsW_063]